MMIVTVLNNRCLNFLYDSTRSERHNYFHVNIIRELKMRVLKLPESRLGSDSWFTVRSHRL